MSVPEPDVLARVSGRVGVITLNRPKALNALSLGMVRTMTQALSKWAADPAVDVVVVHGAPRVNAEGKASVHFCAGGDIRFFHTAALAGDPQLEDFFTEEYALNHLIHRFPKPYVTLIDGVCMGGGMGIAGHGAANACRVVTPAAKLAMPETNIGLFPDVGGGWFLARCPGHLGEYLALTGHVVPGSQAGRFGLADQVASADGQAKLLEHLSTAPDPRSALREWLAANAAPSASDGEADAAFLTLTQRAERFFALPTVLAIVQALEACPASDPAHAWAQETAQAVRQRSPLMGEVTLRQVRAARHLSLADDLRLERDLVRHSFHPRHLGRGATQSDTVEGIRALAVDKDHAPKWQPARLEDVTPEMVNGFFASPWPAMAHPLKQLA